MYSKFHKYPILKSVSINPFTLEYDERKKNIYIYILNLEKIII